MSPDYVRAWLVSFLFTQLIEVPVYRRLLGGGTGRAFVASTLTHPALWFVLFPVLPGAYAGKVALAELFACSVEALYFQRWVGLRRALGAALLANAASFALGLLSRAVLGAP